MGYYCIKLKINGSLPLSENEKEKANKALKQDERASPLEPANLIVQDGWLGAVLCRAGRG